MLPNVLSNLDSLLTKSLPGKFGRMALPRVDTSAASKWLLFSKTRGNEKKKKEKKKKKKGILPSC
jgi:hypothetical protein